MRELYILDTNRKSGFDSINRVAADVGEVNIAIVHWWITPAVVSNPAMA